jgi:tetratricopeptide (TPR) repeat protein
MAGARLRAGPQRRVVCDAARRALKWASEMGDANKILAANAQWAAGNLSGAANGYREVLREDPDDLPAHLNLANVLMQQAKLDDGIGEARAALALAPEDSRAHRALANGYNAKGLLQKAFEHACSAVARGPDVGRNHFVLALVHARLHQRREAEIAFRRARELSPDDAVIVAHFSRFQSERGRKAEAGELAREALAISPHDVDAHVAAGLVALHDWRLEEARAHALTALAQAPSDPDAVRLMAMIRIRRNPVMGAWLIWGLFMTRVGKLPHRILWNLSFNYASMVVIIVIAVSAPLLGAALFAVWLIFRFMTMIGPYLLERMVRRELKQVEIKTF